MCSINIVIISFSLKAGPCRDCVKCINHYIVLVNQRPRLIKDPNIPDRTLFTNKTKRINMWFII